MSRPGVSEFGSVDPAPAHPSSNLQDLRSILLDEDEALFQRMRAVFSLRNINSAESVSILGASFQASSALLRHEVAYVMGQMQNPSALPYLISRLEDLEEHVMVRHEAAEALGAIGDRSIRPLLQRYVEDGAIEVAESCMVALDMLDDCDRIGTES